MINLAIFASGTGSNARRIMEHFEHSPDIRVKLVVSNRTEAPVLATAQGFGVETLVVRRDTFYHTEALMDILHSRQIGFVVLAGFLWLVPAYLVQAYPRRMVNIHPALLPKFGGKGMYGMHVHEAVRAAGETETGITIHYVDERYDEGHIIFQARCPVHPHDTAQDIAKCVQKLEHLHYPVVLEQLLLDRPLRGAEIRG